jgi:hypothetical protein
MIHLLRAFQGMGQYRPLLGAGLDGNQFFGAVAREDVADHRNLFR